MPNTQEKLSLISKCTKSGEVLLHHGSQVMTGSNIMMLLLSQMEADSLAEKISAKVLKGVEASLEKKIDRVLKKHEVCSSKTALLDSRLTKAETLSDTKDQYVLGVAVMAYLCWAEDCISLVALTELAQLVLTKRVRIAIL